MHEVGLIRAVVDTVTGYCRENHVTEVSEILLQIGELSLVIPDYVKKIYPAVVKGSILEHAELLIEIVPGMAECNDCDEIFNVVEHKGYCPNCGSFDKEVLSGRDFLIKELHVPEPRPDP